MLIWHLQEDIPLPDNIRATIVRLIGRGFARSGVLAPKSGAGNNTRINAVAIIYRDGRHDLYPFNRNYSQAFLKASHNAKDGVHRVESDFHTEGYPIYIHAAGQLEIFLRDMYEMGLIDGYVVNDHIRDVPDTLDDLIRPRYIGDSKYRLYLVNSNTIWSAEMWEQEYGEPDLQELYYEYENGRYVRMTDVGDLMPSVRKKMRRHVVSWMRRNARKALDK